MISNIFYLQFPEQYANIELMKDGILALILISDETKQLFIRMIFERQGGGRRQAGACQGRQQSIAEIRQ